MLVAKPNFPSPVGKRFSSSIPSYSNSKIKNWWRGEDSNLRRHRQQIYSLSPLAAREPLRIEIVILGLSKFLPAKKKTGKSESYVSGTKINLIFNLTYLTKYKPFVKSFFKKNAHFPYLTQSIPFPCLQCNGRRFLPQDWPFLLSEK